ncbi:sigma-E factor regulatory protein RseC [Aeromonas molluscorum 848]|uniref:Sigma-E factor regulatory protein RseC n=1 Tax=Aeromonas molluscorum 848 TaxID=1268236 RepID=R1GV60_9GAMM|nr:sigma-E factor regulatory protein RseC [Aeromonas molluscorum 848]
MDEMSEEVATVVAIDEQHVWVECERRSACSGCQQQSNCGTGTVAKAFPQRQQRIRVPRTMTLAVGQQVRLGIPQQSLLRGAALVYVLPPVFACSLAPYSASSGWRPCLRGERVLPSSVVWGAVPWVSCWSASIQTVSIRGLMVPAFWARYSLLAPCHNHVGQRLAYPQTKDWPFSGLSSKILPPYPALT